MSGPYEMIPFIRAVRLVQVIAVLPGGGFKSKQHYIHNTYATYAARCGAVPSATPTTSSCTVPTQVVTCVA